jgi:hypothetical protein
MKAYLDMEFTGLHQRTTLISMALVLETGPYFYAEFNDHEPIDPTCVWLQDNVMAHLTLQKLPNLATIHNDESMTINSNKVAIANALIMWLDKHYNGSPYEIWGDCLAYDWVLFCELFGGALRLPEYIYYMPFDLATLLRANNRDPDFSRCQLMVNLGAEPGVPHNALEDARGIKLIVESAFRIMGVEDMTYPGVGNQTEPE